MSDYKCEASSEGMCHNVTSYGTPCSEKMPDKKDVYLITVSDKATNRTLVCEGGYLGENEWLMPDEDCYRLIAWKSMPEPYKEPEK